MQTYMANGAGTTVPHTDNLHIRRPFACELSLNGVGGKGRVTGELELYHVNVPTNTPPRGQHTSGARGKAAAAGGKNKCTRMMCCGSKC